MDPGFPALLETLIRSAPFGVAFFDRQMRYRFVNERLAALNGVPAEAHVGRTPAEVIPSFPVGLLEAPFRAALETGRPVLGVELSAGAPATPGEERHWRHHWYPVTSGGELIGVATLVEEVTDHRRASADLEHSLQARDALVSLALHELRTPLATIKLAVKALLSGLRDGALDRARTAGRLESIDQHTTALAKVLTRLLDFSRLSSGKLVLALTEVHLQGVVEAAIGHLGPELAEAGCELTFNWEESLTGRWDPVCLERVVTCLLKNCVRYAPGMPIEVRMWRAGEWACLSVRDGGPGIAPELQARIFKLVPRATPLGDGVGIGLWVVQQLVERHGGRVRFESAPGQGAAFTVELPLAGPAAVGVAGA
ncbi:MAG: sensor histidine kinase [Myxococcaceae bacterium]